MYRNDVDFIDYTFFVRKKGPRQVFIEMLLEKKY